MTDITEHPVQVPEPSARLRGVIPPVCTPLTLDREVDKASMEKLITFLIEGGVSGLFVLGSTSEAAFLRDDQRDAVVEVAVATAAGQVPVIAGAIDMTTSRMIDHGRRAVSLGADAIVATAPFYVRTDHRVEHAIHFRALKSELEVPIIAYDIPIAVNRKLAPDLILELAMDGTVSALKDSSGDLGALREVLLGRGQAPGFSVFTGSEILVDCIMLMGADGAVPGLANVDPHGFVKVVNLCDDDQWLVARAEQDRLVRLFDITTCANPSNKGPSSSGLGGFKTALMLLGVISTNAVALPQVPLDVDEIAKVKAVLVDVGLM